MSNETAKIEWRKEPEDHDYPAALSYLTLVFSEATAAGKVEALRKAPVVEFCAKDIFRASGLAELDATNHHVKKNTAKITKGEKLSPILIVRDTDHGRVIVADGYHRLNAVYLYDEDAKIPCKII
jgi:disulfide oxidoreductase YuzD